AGERREREVWHDLAGTRARGDLDLDVPEVERGIPAILGHPEADDSRADRVDQAAFLGGLVEPEGEVVVAGGDAADLEPAVLVQGDERVVQGLEEGQALGGAGQAVVPTVSGAEAGRPQLWRRLDAGCPQDQPVQRLVKVYRLGRGAREDDPALDRCPLA